MKFDPLKMPVDIDGMKIYSAAYNPRDTRLTKYTKCHAIFLKSIYKFLQMSPGSLRNLLHMYSSSGNSASFKQRVRNYRAAYSLRVSRQYYGTLRIANFLPSHTKVLIAIPYAYKRLCALYMGHGHIHHNQKALGELISVLNRNFPSECPKLKEKQLNLAVNTPSMKKYKHEISEKDVCKLIDMVKGLKNENRELSKKVAHHSWQINAIKLNQEGMRKRIKSLEKSKGHILPHF